MSLLESCDVLISSKVALFTCVVREREEEESWRERWPLCLCTHVVTV